MLYLEKTHMMRILSKQPKEVLQTFRERSAQRNELIRDEVIKYRSQHINTINRVNAYYSLKTTIKPQSQVDDEDSVISYSCRIGNFRK